METTTATKLTAYNTYAPLFPGFYESVLSYNSEEVDIDNFNEQNKTELRWDDFTWNYAEYHQRAAKAFVTGIENKLNELLPVQLTFQELVSPREYNFTTDTINVEARLNLDVLMNLIKERRKKAAAYFYARFTPSSGWVPFHSNKISDWLNKNYILETQRKAETRIGVLLDCLCTIEFPEEDVAEWVSSEQWIDFAPIGTRDLWQEKTNAAIYKKMGDYLSVDDDDDYPLILQALKEHLRHSPGMYLDHVEYKEEDDEPVEVPVWEKMEMKFDVREFCELVGITNDDENNNDNQ